MYVTRLHEGQYKVYKRGGSEPCYASTDKKDADRKKNSLNESTSSIAQLIANVITGDTIASGAIQALMDAPPVLMTVKNIEIVKTGIEYPLATGPTTFTPDDLAEAVAAVDDPAIHAPRIWLGHPDDPRIHGKRMAGGPPSGEPAIGRVTNMHLEEDGHKIVGDLEGVPAWLAGIMSSAFPSRSIEGNFDVQTPTGHKWRLVISGLALLGVCWPGVSTLEDIASLYTADGPDNVEIIQATEDQPVTVVAAAERIVSGQATVEDLRRQYYDSLNGDQAWWWIRAIMVNPNELIIDDDDGGLYSQAWSENDGEFEFGDPVKKKVKYVNASNGAIVANAVDGNREHVAFFASRADSRPGAAEPPAPSPDELVIPLAVEATEKSTSQDIHVNITIEEVTA